MKNKLGKNESLEGYHPNGEYSYVYFTTPDGDFSSERTYDERGNRLTHKNSTGYSCEYTYDYNNNYKTYKNNKAL